MIKSEIINILRHFQFDGIAIDINLLEIPQNRTMGEIALPCFNLSKILKKSPQHIALAIAHQLREKFRKHNIIANIVATGPYVNFFISTTWLGKNILNTIEEKKDNYGKGDIKNKTILVEGRSPNTHKMLHIGHLRNALISEAMCNIIEFAGYTVIRVAYGGDIGAHVAKWIWYYINFTNKVYPQNPEAFGIWSGEIYQKATQKINENPKIYKEEIHTIQKLLESGDKELQKIWKETRSLSIMRLQNIFDELGCNIEKFYRESEVEQEGIKLIKEYEQNKKIPEIKKSKGAIIADLTNYNLGIFVLLKSNDTSLYSTKDIALAYLKEKEYNFDTSLYVVGTEQNLYFQQLFKTLDLVGYDVAKLIHMGYELVELPEGKMSSRKGTIIPYHIWRQDALEQAMNLISFRDIENKEILARDVAFAALKFSFLLQDTYKKIIIDIKKSISFQGETGPYIQYTVARCESILQKGKKKIQEGEKDYSLLNQEEERILLVLLSEFGAIVEQASQEYKPHLIARYILELTKTFNNYYQKYKIIENDIILSNTRLSLIFGVQQVLKNGLRLLGISTPEKM